MEDQIKKYKAKKIYSFIFHKERWGGVTFSFEASSEEEAITMLENSLNSEDNKNLNIETFESKCEMKVTIKFKLIS